MPGVQTDVTKSFEINGIDARDYNVELSTIGGRGLPAEVIAREFSFPDEGGAPRQYGDLPGVGQHTLSGYVVGTDRADARRKYEGFLMAVGLPVDIGQQLLLRDIKSQMLVLRYLDEPHKKYRALYSGGHSRRELREQQWRLGRFIFFEMTFKIPDVYAYGDEIVETLTLSATSQFMKVPTGTVASRPRLIYKNDTAQAVTPVGITGGRFGLNTSFAEEDDNGYPKARGIKNDISFAGDFQGGAAYETAKLGQGLFFGGRSIGADHLWFYTELAQSTPSGAITSHFNANQGTVSFWFKSSTNWNDGTKWYFFDAGNSGLHLIKDTDNFLKVYDAVSGNSSTLDVSALVAGTWYLVVAAWDRNAATKLQCYAGASSLTAGSSQTSYTATTPGQKFYVVSDSSGNNSPAGVLDELRVYDHRLFGTELTNLINAGSGTLDEIGAASLLAYYNLDGTVASLLVSGTASDLGGSNVRFLKNNGAVTTTAFPVAAGGDVLFVRGERIRLSDDIGYDVQGFVPTSGGTLSATAVPISSAVGSLVAITNADRVGVYARFSGSNDAATGDVYDLGTNDFAISCWARLNTGASGDNHLFSKSIAGASGNRWHLRYRFSTGGFNLIIHTLDAAFPGSSEMEDGRWHHIFVLGDRSGNAYLYLDGVAKGSADISSVSASNVQSNDPFRVGNVQGLADGWGDGGSGDIRDFTLWQQANLNSGDNGANDALTARENPRASTNVNGNAPTARWEFNEGSGTNVNEEIGGSNDFTLTASSMWQRVAYLSNQLLVDRSQELGTLTAWKRVDTADITMVASKDTTAANIRKDLQSLKFVEDASQKLVQQTINTASGEDWILRGYYLASGADNAHLAVVGNTLNDSISVGPSGSWAYLDVCFEADDTTVNVRLGADANDTAYWDDVTLVPNLINNGGVEGGANPPTGWTQLASTTLTSDATSHFGTNGGKIVTSANSTGAQSADFSTTSGRFYLVSLWVRTDSGAETFTVQIEQNAVYSTVLTGSATTTYTRFAAVVEATNTQADADIRILVDTSGGTIFFDDVAVEELSPLSTEAVFLNASRHYALTRRGKGMHLNGETLVFGAVGNTTQWGCLWRGRPQFSYTVASDVTLFEHWFDATNYCRIFYDASEDKFVFRKTAGGTDFDASTRVVSFPADQEISIIGSFDDVNGSDIWFNGSNAGSTQDADTTAIGTVTTVEEGTAQAGAAASITLASGASGSDDNYNDWVVEIFEGTGAGQQRSITDYNGTTKVATIRTNWSTQPDSTSKYLLYSSPVVLGANKDGSEAANAIVDEVAVFVQKFTNKEATALHARNEPVVNHNGHVRVTTAIGSDDFLDVDCERLTVDHFDVSASPPKANLLGDAINTNNSRFLLLHPGESHADGDVVWAQMTGGELEVRAELRYV